MTMYSLIKRDERGAGAVEFALAAPVLFTMVIGIAQLGILFFANSGLQHSVEEAGRRAAVFPMPSDDIILAELNSSRFGRSTGTITPTLTHGRAADCMTYVDISLSYQVPLDFIFFETDPVTVGHTRRVFTQPATPTPCTPATSSSSTTSTSTTSSTSTGDPSTSTTSTSTGDPSTSTTSASTTSSTTSTSSGSVPSTSSTTTTGGSNGSSGKSSSGNGNGSSGNNNGSSGK